MPSFRHSKIDGFSYKKENLGLSKLCHEFYGDNKTLPSHRLTHISRDQTTFSQLIANK